MGVVGKGDIRANENIIFEPHAVPNLDAALDCYPVADADVVLNKRVIAEIALGANHRARQDVRESPYPRASPDRGAFHNRSFVLEVGGRSCHTSCCVVLRASTRCEPSRLLESLTPIPEVPNSSMTD